GSGARDPPRGAGLPQGPACLQPRPRHHPRRRSGERAADDRHDPVGLIPMRRWLLFAVLALAAAGATLWATGLAGLAQAWIAMQSLRAEWQNKGLWLPHYSAVLQARPIEGLADNVSGLTFSSHTGTLFTVVNRPPSVAELS